MSTSTRAKDPTVLDRLREAREARDRAREAFADQVRQAMAERNGYTVKEIADVAELSRERVYQIAGRR